MKARGWLQAGVIATAVLLPTGCLPIRSGTVTDRPANPTGSGRTEIKDDVARVDHREPADRSTVAAEPPLEHPLLNKAEDLFRRDEFGAAEGIFESVAEDTKNRPEAAERARYYQGESLRKQGYYPKAVDAYNRLLKDFPAGLYRTRAVGRMYEISEEWLAPTYDEMRPEAERKLQRDMLSRIVPVNFERKLPTVDSEGRALKALEDAYFGDPTGPYADKILFALGKVNFHRKEFKESSRFFQQLVETHDRSPLRDDALYLAIVAKTNAGSGPDLDGRESTEAMRLINAAKQTSPGLMKDKAKADSIEEQAYAVRVQQAAKDFEIAEFYRRTGHPGSAWYCYELVVRRYPGIKPYHGLAQQRQKELKQELDDAKSGKTGSLTRFWYEFVLGRETPTLRGDLPEMPLRESAPPSVPAGPSAAGIRAATVPSDIRPR